MKYLRVKRAADDGPGAVVLMLEQCRNQMRYIKLTSPMNLSGVGMTKPI